MSRVKLIITYIVVATLGVVPSYSASQPSEERFRDRCRKLDVSLPSLSSVPLDAWPFQDITPERIRGSSFSTDAVSLQSLQGLFDMEGKFNEAEEGAIILVITNRNQAAKLVAGVEGTDLLIRKFVTYGATGETTAQGENLRLSEDGLLDLDGVAVSPPAAAADLRWTKSGTTSVLQPSSGARLAILDPIVAVPVIGHFMKSRDHRYEIKEDVWMAELQEVFTPEGRVNQIWKQAGVLFTLYRLERCTYSLLDFLVEKPVGEFEFIPSPIRDCRCLFRRINGAYNFRRVHGLDLYLWSEIGFLAGRLTGYGAQQREDGPNPGAGAIWVNTTECTDGDCGLVYAHEAGHFLGLCHVCVTERTPPGERGWCGFCPNIPDCATGQEDLLMRDDAQDRTGSERLSSKEIRDARQKALEYRLRRITGAGSQ